MSLSPTPARPAAPAAGGVITSQQAAYSHIQDRVVQTLLRRGLVEAAHVSDAEAHRRQMPPNTPLWRALAAVPAVDRDVVFEQAAATYAFRIAPVKEREPEAEFAKTVLESFDQEVSDRLVELGAVPYAYAQDQPSGILKLVFITEDPMRPELGKAINALELER